MNDLEAAIEIALETYVGQEDKAEATLIRHPLHVMESMETETERLVAVLHDAVEDSEYTLGVIHDRFISVVRDAVDALARQEEQEVCPMKMNFFIPLFSYHGFQPVFRP